MLLVPVGSLKFFQFVPSNEYCPLLELLRNFNVPKSLLIYIFAHVIPQIPEINGLVPADFVPFGILMMYVSLMSAVLLV